MTLACDGRFYSLHKFVLATCSDYFEEMFEKTQCKHPVVVLKDIKKEDFEALLSYMYVGEVNVVQEKLSSLLKSAECLRIKGLAVPDENPAVEQTSSNKDQLQHNKRRAADGSPSAKKRKRESTETVDVNRTKNIEKELLSNENHNNKLSNKSTNISQKFENEEHVSFIILS